MPGAVPRIGLAPDLSVSRIITGLWQIADLERGGRLLNRDATADHMLPYVKAGLTTFDMADHYGSAEVIAGRFRARHAPAGRVELLTKWVPKPGPVTRDDVRVAIEGARQRLGVEAIDLLQFHIWNYADPRWLDCLFWLQEFKAQGLIRHLGLTNVDAAHLRMVVKSGIPVVSNQVCFSLLDRRPLTRMTAACQELGVKLLAYGTVAGGFLSERWLGKPEPDWNALDTWARMKYGRFIRAEGSWGAFQKLLQAADRVAERHGVSIANVACRYVLEQPAVAGIIVGARLGRSEYLEETLRIFEFELDAADRAELEVAMAGLEPIPGDCGDEYRRPPFLTAAGDLSHHVESFPAPYGTKSGPAGRTLALSGTPWESFAGYCRATRVGSRVLVSGTTATHGDRLIGGTDPAAQTHFVIDKIEGALQSLGARLEHVVRTRVFVNRIGDWEAVARAHGERFGDIQPVNTLVEASLVGKQYVVEMEAEAVVSE